MSDILRLFCKQKGCHNSQVIYFRKYRAIRSEIEDQGWKYEDGKYYCKDCVNKTREKSDEIL